MTALPLLEDGRRGDLHATTISVPAVLVAGNIGITPTMSMLRRCVAAQPGRTVHLHYGVRNSAGHAFKQVLEDLTRTHPTFRLHAACGNPGPDDVERHDHQHAGRIDPALLRSTLPHGRHQFYVCRPPAMSRSLVPALRDWHVLEEDIHFEAFGPATMRPEAPASNEPAASAANTARKAYGTSRTARDATAAPTGNRRATVPGKAASMAANVTDTDDSGPAPQSGGPPFGTAPTD